VSTAISVIVPVRDAAATLGDCLDGLAAQQLGGVDIEVIVVDNGSRDGTPQLARDHPLRPRVISEPRPGSYSARNAGLAVAQGKAVAFTDGDCIPRPTWLAHGLRALQAAHLVGGRVRPRLSTAPTRWERFDAGHHVDQRKYVEVLGFGATANLFVRHEVFDRIGCFDGRLRSGGDREFCIRATAAGFRLAYAGDVEVTHRSRRTARETWNLHRRLGVGLRDLSRRGMQPPAWRDDQMLLPIGWAAQVASGPDRVYRQREMVGLAAVVVAARWTGRLTGR
jgi:glycosyltransferase involved in cell wall biosynthesis